MDMDMDSMDMSSSDSSCSMDMLGNWKTIGSCFLTSSWHISTAAQFAGTCIGVFLIVVVIESVRRWGREWDRYIVRKAIEDHQRWSKGTRGVSNNTRGRERQGANTCCSTNDVESLSSASESEKAADQEEGVAHLNNNNNDDASLSKSASGQKASVPPRGAQTISKLERAFFALPASSAGAKALRADRPVPMFRPSVLQQAIRSLVYAVQFTGAYIVMLIAMSYNGYILISIVLGGLVGHFFSTWDTLSFPLDESSEDLNLFGAGELQQVSEPHYPSEGRGVSAKDRTADFEANKEIAAQRSVKGQDLYGAASGACCN